MVISSFYNRFCIWGTVAMKQKLLYMIMGAITLLVGGFVYLLVEEWWETKKVQQYLHRVYDMLDSIDDY